MKLKVKPSAKIKRRYILFNDVSKKEVETVVLNYLGILGWARAACIFVKDMSKKKRLILSVDVKSLNDVRAAFEIAETKAKIVKVSGTIKGLGK